MSTIQVMNNSNFTIKIATATAVTDSDGHGDLLIQQRRTLPGTPVTLPAGVVVDVEDSWWATFQEQNVGSPLLGVIVPVSNG